MAHLEQVHCTGYTRIELFRYFLLLIRTFDYLLNFLLVTAFIFRICLRPFSQTHLRKLRNVNMLNGFPLLSRLPTRPSKFIDSKHTLQRNRSEAQPALIGWSLISTWASYAICENIPFAKHLGQSICPFRQSTDTPFPKIAQRKIRCGDSDRISLTTASLNVINLFPSR